MESLKLFKCHRKKWIIFTSILLLSYSIKQLTNNLYPDINSLLDLKKCPLCYGDSACYLFLQNQIQIEPFDLYSKLAHIFPLKNVYYGFLNKTKKIVLKKLASNSELLEFDNMICRDPELLELCSGGENIDKIDYISRVELIVSANYYDKPSTISLCPGTSHLDTLINLSGLNHSTFWMLTEINPEPILLKDALFPSDAGFSFIFTILSETNQKVPEGNLQCPGDLFTFTETFSCFLEGKGNSVSLGNKADIIASDLGWPVPQYYGACGRIILQEYIGPPLSKYYHEPWLRRAKIAIGLLQIAHNLTLNHPNFAFYLTDISPDNIAVDYHNRPKIIDLENLIILDKNYTGDKPEWFKLHQSQKISNCTDCFSFSRSDICSHQISDHNFYSICQHILLSDLNLDSNGFLHNVPTNILNKYPKLMSNLNDCANPIANISRLDAAGKLIELLKEIVDKN